MSRTFAQDGWTFEWSANGVGPTVIFLSRSSLKEEANNLARALEKDFFVTRLTVSGSDKVKFAKAVEAFFEEQQLWRVHWIVTKDALDLLGELGESSRVVWSFTSEAKVRGESFTLATEAMLRQKFAEADPPYRTSEHPL
jgi:hypothetical protein